MGGGGSTRRGWNPPCVRRGMRRTEGSGQGEHLRPGEQPHWGGSLSLRPLGVSLPSSWKFQFLTPGAGDQQGIKKAEVSLSWRQFAGRVSQQPPAPTGPGSCRPALQWQVAEGGISVTIGQVGLKGQPSWATWPNPLMPPPVSVSSTANQNQSNFFVGSLAPAILSCYLFIFI